MRVPDKCCRGKIFTMGKKCRNISYVKCRCYYLKCVHGVNAAVAPASRGEALIEGCGCVMCVIVCTCVCVCVCLCV